MSRYLIAGVQMTRDGTGNDMIWTTDGHDRLFGDAGRNIFDLNSFADPNRGDFLNADSIFGGTVNDRLFGEAGNDTLNAGSGNDLLCCGARKDSLFGGTPKSGPLLASDKVDISAIGQAIHLTDGPFVTNGQAQLHYLLNDKVLAADFTGDGNIDWFIVLQTDTLGVIVDSDLIF